MHWLRHMKASMRRQAQARLPWQGERVDIDRYWAEAWQELQQRQKRLIDVDKLARASWQVDQDRGLIEFARADGAIARAPVQIIGAWNPLTHAFVWGWSHPSVRTRLRADAERTRWFGEKHDLVELTQAQLELTEREAWRLAAVAMKVNAAMGIYRGPTDGPLVFMNLGEVSLG
ncbi:MAG: hypothetical protein JNJ73_00595 [Hyphomonadaceae bacterium]|nr:hypothetical protein [Hyphomonadaceae bacterium]